jgi:chromate reductase, NAD(P)H dehydrogenase (quinone)
MSNPKILVFAASLRKGSLNRRLADTAAPLFQAEGAEVTKIDLHDYAMPVYDGDIEADQGLPQAAQDLHELFRAHDGIFIASPEYNASHTPLMANVLAWVSRVVEHGGMAAAFGKPVFALGSVSPGAYGGYRGLMALRQSLELQLQARVLPAMVAVGNAKEAFTEEGELVDKRSLQALNRVVPLLVSTASTMAAARDAQ